MVAGPGRKPRTSQPESQSVNHYATESYVSMHIKRIRNICSPTYVDSRWVCRSTPLSRLPPHTPLTRSSCRQAGWSLGYTSTSQPYRKSPYPYSASRCLATPASRRTALFTEQRVYNRNVSCWDADVTQCSTFLCSTPELKEYYLCDFQRPNSNTLRKW